MGWVAEWQGTSVLQQPGPIVVIPPKERKPIKEPFNVKDWRK